MKHSITPLQIHAFVDGELDLTPQLEMEAQLAQDAALRAQVQSAQSLRDTVRDGADYHAAPAALRSRIQALGGTPPQKAAAAAPGQRWFAWRPMGLALAALGLLVWGLTLSLGLWPSSHDERLMQEAIASHARATLGQRLVDVASSDQHTVKPWLSSRLDYSPPVHEPRLPGVVFLGGRVDYLDGRPVAALVYKQHEHIVDVFVWPTLGADTPMRALSYRGFNVHHGSRAGMNYWVVSDLNPGELAVLAQSLQIAELAR